MAPSPDESPGRLPEPVVSLLRQGVTCHVQAWKDAVARDAEAADSLRQFLGSSGVAKHPVWKEVFGSLPPRGVVSRMARRLGVDVHGNVGFYNYSSKKEFKREVRRIRDWYGVGRREVKSASSKRRKILRSAARRQARRVRSPARSIMNAKVKLHYARLLNKTRVQGLWRWRAAALAMLDAGLPMQTGTVAVERLWAQVQAIFPPQGRGMSLAWFQLLSNLAYLRVNYNHYNGASLPPWCKHDAVLKQSLDGLLSLALSFSQAGGSCGCAYLVNNFVLFRSGQCRCRMTSVSHRS